MWIGIQWNITQSSPKMKSFTYFESKMSIIERHMISLTWNLRDKTDEPGEGKREGETTHKRLKNRKQTDGCWREVSW